MQIVDGNMTISLWLIGTICGMIGFLFVTGITIIGYFVRNAWGDLKKQVSELVGAVSNLTSEMNKDFVRHDTIVQNVDDHKRIWQAMEVRQRDVEEIGERVSEIEGVLKAKGN